MGITFNPNNPALDSSVTSYSISVTGASSAATLSWSPGELGVTWDDQHSRITLDLTRATPGASYSITVTDGENSYTTCLFIGPSNLGSTRNTFVVNPGGQQFLMTVDARGEMNQFPVLGMADAIINSSPGNQFWQLSAGALPSGYCLCYVLNVANLVPNVVRG